MPKLFAVSIALFLLLAAGYGLTQAARAIPWDCSDWQPFAHADRPTAILESLAENRGKTLYCGLDQSDTFGKAETWQAGKDRNERDDTVYWGERGSFRGFIAAQEGWLTEGESGITGQSIATIFEFPREKKKRRRYKWVVVEELEVAADSSRLAYGPYGGIGAGSSQQQARSYGEAAYNEAPPAVDWPDLALAAAVAHCRPLGYNRFWAAATVAATESWYYDDVYSNPPNYGSRAGKTRQWTSTCQKNGTPPPLNRLAPPCPLTPARATALGWLIFPKPTPWLPATGICCRWPQSFPSPLFRPTNCRPVSLTSTKPPFVNN